MIEKVRQEVNTLLCKDNSGHGMDHIDRVLNMSLEFAEREKANNDVVSLIALLHDVDDYKLFGKENAKNLTNAKMIMEKCGVDINIQKQVLETLKCFGYSKLLKGLRPSSIEGKIVSDADMCDALGATGIIRIYSYSMKKGKPFFDRNTFPILDMNPEEYSNRTADTSVCHMFEKILKLKDLMLTEAGKEEALNRHEIIVDFLYHLFDEEKTPEWKEFLDNYLNGDIKNESDNNKTAMGNSNRQKIKRI